MNEEEIINILEDMLEKAGKLYEEEFYTLVEDKHMWAVRGLLNLYNQEKEKNKKLEEVIDLMAEDLDNDIAFNNCVLEKGATICKKEIDCVKCVKEYYFNKAKEDER